MSCLCIALLLAEESGEFAALATFIKFAIFAACEGGPLVLLYEFLCCLLTNLMNFPQLSDLLNLPYLRLCIILYIASLLADELGKYICHTCCICQICHIRCQQRPYCLLTNLINFAKFVIACVSGHISLASYGIFLLYLSHFVRFHLLKT